MVVVCCASAGSAIIMAIRPAYTIDMPRFITRLLFEE